MDPHPDGVTALWYPGLTQQPPCSEPVTHGSAALATTMRHDIDHAHRYADGGYACPGDSGSAVHLYFTHHGHPADVVAVTLTGCSAILTSGDSNGLMPGELEEHLRPITSHDLDPH